MEVGQHFGRVTLGRHVEVARPRQIFHQQEVIGGVEHFRDRQASVFTQPGQHEGLDRQRGRALLVEFGHKLLAAGHTNRVNRADASPA